MIGEAAQLISEAVRQFDVLDAVRERGTTWAEFVARRGRAANERRLGLGAVLGRACVGAAAEVFGAVHEDASGSDNWRGVDVSRR